MSKKELRRSLERLRSEIDSVEQDNRPARERLDRLVADIEHQIENENDIEHRATMLEGIPNLVDEFETNHPKLTGILNHIMVTLSNMGI